MKKGNPSWNMLVRFFEDESSPEENRFMRQWMASDSEHDEFITTMKEVWNSDAEVKEEWNVDAAWHRFRMEHKEEFLGQEATANQTSNLMGKTHSSAVWNQVRSSHSSSRYQWRRVAAAVAVVLVALFVLYQAVDQPSGKTDTVAMRTIVSPEGQRIPIKFSDGSRMDERKLGV